MLNSQNNLLYNLFINNYIMAVTPEQNAEFDILADQVRANGFTSLKTHKERNRYRELKAMIDADNTTMTVTKAEVEKMIADAVKSAQKGKAQYEDDLAEVRKLSEWKPYQPPKKGNPTAKLKLYRIDGVSEPGLIIDWKFKANRFNEETRKNDIPVYQISVLYDDGEKKTYDIDLISMVQITELEEVEIIEQKVEDQVMVAGKGVKAFTKGGYNFSSPGFFGVKQQAGGEQFDLEVHRQDINCVIKRPNGKTLKIHSSRLNQ